jgi:hypothetical protein
MPLLRMSCILTHSPNIAVAAPTHTTPTLNRRCRIIRPTTRLRKVHRQPITPVRNPIKELIVLSRAHGIDSNIEMPGVTHVVDFGRGACIAVRTAGESVRGRTLVDDFEDEGVRAKGDAGGGDGRDPVADSAGGTGATAAGD